MEKNRSYTYRINEIKLSIGEPTTRLPHKIERKLRLKPGAVQDWKLVRESVDARRKEAIRLSYTVDFTLSAPLGMKEAEQKRHKVKLHREEVRERPRPGGEKLLGRPVVVGFGPCGIFAALTLAQQGYRPLVLERGAAMAERVRDVARFREEGRLDPESNVLFGEGGAGTFSDGKLSSGIKDGHVREVLETFAQAGAGEDILYRQKPHIGTDVLRRVIVSLREQLIALGGEIRFGAKMTAIKVENGALSGISICQRKEDGALHTVEEESNALILATGHSARDVFRLVKAEGLSMAQKPFSIGVRMEHPQELIDRAQYGEEKRLPPAEYKLSVRTANGRGVYSFCMCPGGEVIVCTTEDGLLCVNGMSNRKRDSGTANSGILCDVRTEDFGSDDVLAGVAFQEKYERLAFCSGGGGFRAPKCSMKAFLENAPESEAVVRALPAFAVEAIREAVPHFAAKIKGYDRDDAVITAVETRSSSPVRVLRDKETGESSVRGIYPSGEGCGYAGGITSAACDGIRQAERVIARFALPDGIGVKKD